jgi:hypothetical protein
VARIAALAEMVDIALYAWAQYLRGRSKAFRSRQACWLVSDRSFDDVLAKHLRRGTLPPSALRTVRRLSPPIETTIWLRLEPEIALLRDGDFSAPYYEQADSAYGQLSEWMTLAVVSTGESESDEVARRVRMLLNIDEPRPIASDAQGGSLSRKRY